MTKFGELLFYLKVMRLYKDGDTFGMLLNWWHPLAWFLAIFCLIFGTIVHGAPKAWEYRHEFGWRMNPFFVEHPDRLVWITDIKDTQ